MAARLNSGDVGSIARRARSVGFLTVVRGFLERVRTAPAAVNAAAISALARTYLYSDP